MSDSMILIMLVIALIVAYSPFIFHVLYLKKNNKLISLNKRKK